MVFRRTILRRRREGRLRMRSRGAFHQERVGAAIASRALSSAVPELPLRKEGPSRTYIKGGERRKAAADQARKRQRFLPSNRGRSILRYPELHFKRENCHQIVD